MPFYEFKCKNCNVRFEELRKMGDVQNVICPSCKSKNTEFLYSTPAIQFKGSGFYITDYKKSTPKNE